MGRVLAAVVVVAGLVWLMLATAPASSGRFRKSLLEQRVAEIRPELERVLNDELGGPVEIRVSTPEELAGILAAEFTAIAEALQGGESPERARAFFEAQSDMLSRYMLGKVEVETGVLHVMPENFRWIAEASSDWREVHSADFRDLILIHELVHVYQQRRFGLAAFVRGAEAVEGVPARGAVVEGHAQFVTRRVAARMGLSHMLDLWESTITVVPDDAPDFVQGMLRGAQSITSFPYVQGEKFVEAVVRELGYEAALERLFADPPRTVHEVWRPAEYQPPTEDSRRFATAVRHVRRLLEEAGDTVAEDETLLPWLADAPSGRRSVQLVGTWRSVRLDLSGGGEITVEALAVDPDAETRLAACARELVRAVDEGSPWSGLPPGEAADAFRAALDDPHWGVRWRALRNLARLDADGAKVVRPRLADPNESVRLAAVRFLADRGRLTRDDLDRLQKDPCGEVVEAARRAFGLQ